MSAQGVPETSVNNETQHGDVPSASLEAGQPPDGEQQASETPVDSLAKDQSSAAFEPSPSDREQAAARIQQLTGLPQELRDRLAALVLAGGKTEGNGAALVPIDEAARAVEESLPDFLRPGRDRATTPRHPGGEEFFYGDPAALSDAQAEELARGQLVRSGLLRGQRARVAD
jgi:hypothetical protein